MENLTYRVVGVMSGTSLDGIDIALIDFVKSKEGWGFNIVLAETLAYSKEWKDKLAQASHLSKEEITHLDVAYTDELAAVILSFLSRHSISLSSLDAVCSHGHTVLHQSEAGITIQIGNLPVLAQKIGMRVVCDFRVEDVALGGQGAPLVPIGDQILFTEFDYCLNLGGFANISLEENGSRLAYDICAVNTVLNVLSQKMGVDYDEDGRIAASGEINQDLLRKLNELSFYQKSPPKSLGVEWVVKDIMPLLEETHISIPHKITTFTYHIAQQIANNLVKDSSKKVLVTGGGAYNKTLIEFLKSMSVVEVIIPSKEIVEFKEALIFGFLGVLKLEKEVNVLKSVTGASKNHSSGKVFLP